MSWSTSNNVYGSYLKKPSLYSNLNVTNNYPFNYSTCVSTYPKGLENLTNTCYISAVLQVLFLIIEEKDFPIYNKKRQEITYYFFQLKKSKDRDVYKTFKEVIEQKIQIVRGWEQQDSQQLLVLLLEEISKENSLPLKPGRMDLSYRQNESIEKNWLRYVSEMLKMQNSKIIDLFYGQIIRRFSCQKGHDKHNFDRYNHISLSFTKKSKYNSSYYSRDSININDMLNDFKAAEQIEDLECQKCKKKMSFTKQTAFYSTPQYLILHLSRFMKGYFDSEKNDREVQFDSELVLNNIKQQKTRYKLIGLVNHIGSMNRGHYYANVIVDGQWYQMNDEKVYRQTIRERGNVSSRVYLLIYRKS